MFEMRDSNDRGEQLVKRLEVYTDSDWASDQVTRKSTSGAVIMAEGMRVHAHSWVKQIDSRILWLQDLIAAGGVRLKKIPRTQNLADMLTHTPSAKELEVFLPLMSLRICSVRDKELMATKQYKPVPIVNAKVYSHG